MEEILHGNIVLVFEARMRELMNWVCQEPGSGRESSWRRNIKYSPGSKATDRDCIQ